MSSPRCARNLRVVDELPWRSSRSQDGDFVVGTEDDDATARMVLGVAGHRRRAAARKSRRRLTPDSCSIFRPKPSSVENALSWLPSSA